jgi:predicted choloylglycine hydrolase
MRRTLRALRSDRPEHEWPALFRSLWPAYRRWYSRHGVGARPTFLACEREIRRHMPELFGTYELLCSLAGGHDLAARFLSLYGPGPFLTGCSQACRTAGPPLLVRNYDYDPMLWDAIFLRSAWNGRAVMAMIDCAWGVLDGINEDGLTVALAFGGRNVVGDGFGAPLILRYILEFCSTTTEAIDVLRRVPSHMAYNVTILDRTGDAKTVHIGPDRSACVVDRPFSANHQNGVEWEEYARVTNSLEREERLSAIAADAGMSVDAFIDSFLEPPLHARDFAAGWGTLYTAAYEPAARAASLVWPDRKVEQKLDDFTGFEIDLELGNGA